MPATASWAVGYRTTMTFSPREAGMAFAGVAARGTPSRMVAIRAVARPHDRATVLRLPRERSCRGGPSRCRCHTTKRGPVLGGRPARARLGEGKGMRYFKTPVAVVAVRDTMNHAQWPNLT